MSCQQPNIFRPSKVTTNAVNSLNKILYISAGESVVYIPERSATSEMKCVSSAFTSEHFCLS